MSDASSSGDCGSRPKFIVGPTRLGVTDYTYPVNSDEHIVISPSTRPSSVVTAVQCTYAADKPDENVPGTKAERTMAEAFDEKLTLLATKKNETLPSAKESISRLLAIWSANSTGLQNVIISCCGLGGVAGDRLTISTMKVMLDRRRNIRRFCTAPYYRCKFRVVLDRVVPRFYGNKIIHNFVIIFFFELHNLEINA